MIPQQKELRKYADAKKAQFLMRFFKTGPGEYAEGDQFIGVTVPQNKTVALKFIESTEKEISILFKSPIHEDRLLALNILVNQYNMKKEIKEKQKIINLYLKNKKHINNWDLVDTSAYKLLGQHCILTQNLDPIIKLSKSKKHWDKRISIVSTYALIKQNQLDLTYQIAQQFLTETEDLMHKATGWMLREAGKRDQTRLLQFINKHGKKMPRTMLRYAIEKFPKKKRKEILASTK